MEDIPFYGQNRSVRLRNGMRGINIAGSYIMLTHIPKGLRYDPTNREVWKIGSSLCLVPKFGNLKGFALGDGFDVVSVDSRFEEHKRRLLAKV